MTLAVLLLSAAWLGILTAISPCPLATNIAAVMFIGKTATHPRQVFLAGIMYTLGRTVFYVLLAIAILYGLLSAPRASLFFQKYIIMVLGPLLILVGMFLVGLMALPIASSFWTAKFTSRMKNASPVSAFALGFLFASAFCPVSGAIFFGSLLPLSLQAPSFSLPPLAFGIGTGLPVLALALAIAFGVSSFSAIFKKITRIEYMLRIATGIVFLGVGIYFTLKYLYRIG